MIEWDDSAPTKAAVKSSSRRAAQAQQAALIDSYRASHPELDPKAADKTVADLIYLHSWGYLHAWGAATAAHSGETRDTRQARKP